MLSAAVLPLRPLCAGVARDRYYETEGSCGPEDGVHWRITGDTLRIWGEGTMEDDWGSAWDMQEPCIAAGVRHVVIEEGVTDVADRLMEDVGTVESVRLPKGLRRIGGGAFENCGLKGELVLPEGLEQIGNYAFSDCDNIVSVWLPGSVWNIGYNAFFGCRAMRRVEIGEGMKSIDLEDVLDGTGVTEIYVPASMEDIDFSEIKKRERRVEIVLARENRRYRERNGMVYDMRDSAVVDCDTMKCGKVVLPEWVRRIGNSAFEDNDRLTGIEIPEGVQRIGGKAFAGCDGLREVSIRGNMYIGSEVFARCKGIERVRLSGDITGGASVFERCESLREAEVDCEVVGDWMFDNCKALEKVRLSGRVKSIGYCAFRGCVSLTGVELPDGLLSIKESAFARSGLKGVVLPPCMMYVYNRAFAGCDSLVSIEMADGECGRKVDKMNDRVYLGPSANTIYRGRDYIEVEVYREPVREYVTHDGVLYRRNGGKLIADVIPEGKTGTWELPAADSVEVSTELFKQAVRQFSRIRCTGGIVPETRTYRYSYPDGNPDRVSGCVLEVPQGTRKEFEREEIDGMVNWWSLFDEIEEM